MIDFFKRLLGKATPEKQKQHVNKSTSENQAENSKLKRPDFTKEETLALGLFGLSFSMVNGRPEPKAEAIIIRELEDFTLDDVKRLYQYAQDGNEKEQQHLGFVLAMGLALNFVRIQYAAGFWAKVIRARSDGDDPSLFESWHKTVKKLGLNIKGMQGVDCLNHFANLYDNEYEHGKGPEDDLFIISAWLSNLKYLQHDQTPSERISEKEVESYDNKTVFTVDDKVSFTMIRVDGGTFTMGGFEDDEDAYAHERPRHEVSVSTFLMGETQVTQELWEAVMGDNPSNFKGNNKPVELVSWNDCQTFIKKLNEKTGKKFRLPTEAEWEYAARGGRQSKDYTFSGSNNRNEVAWHPGNRGSETTHDVKTKLPNELGIYDMSGNVLEWVNDWFDNYPHEKQTDPTGPSYGRYKVLRGGSWYNPSSFCRVSFRNYMEPDSTNFMYGLRLAL